MGHYEVLGVSPDSSMAEIRRRYLLLARASHPDFHTDGGNDRALAEERMREINAAWAVLGDVEQRSAYDRDRLRSRQQHAPRPTRPFHATAAAHEAFHPFDDGPDAEFDDSDDRPITPSRLPGWLVLAPPSLLVGGLAALAVGSITNIVAVVDLGLISMLFSGLLFLVAPLVALAGSRRGDRSP